MSNSANLARNIYVGLEDLFDVRLSRLVELYPGKLGEIIEAGYFKRERDEFPVVGLDYEGFKAAYANRTAQTLMGALRTHVFDMVGQAIFGFLEEMIHEPFRGIPTLRINTYPYELPESVANEIASEFQAVIGTDVPVAFDWVRIAPEALDPKWLGREHSLIFMYDCLTWMDLMGERLSGTELYTAEVVVPGLFLDQPVTGEQIVDEETEFSVHPFEAIRILARRLINLRFIPASFFSVVCPENPPIAPPEPKGESEPYTAHLNEKTVAALAKEHKHPIWDVAAEFSELSEAEKYLRGG